MPLVFSLIVLQACPFFLLFCLDHGADAGHRLDGERFGQYRHAGRKLPRAEDRVFAVAGDDEQHFHRRNRELPNFAGLLIESREHALQPTTSSASGRQIMRATTVIVGLVGGLALTAAARADGADAVIEFNSDFLQSVAVVAPTLKLPNEFDNLVIASATYCPSNDHNRFLVLLSKSAIISGNPTLSKADCDSAPALLTTKPHNSALQAALYLYVANSSDGSGLVFTTSDVAIFFDGSMLSADELDRLRSVKVTYGSFSVPLQIGNTSKNIDVAVKFSANNIVARLSQMNVAPHHLTDAELPAGDATTNTLVAISTEAIAWTTRELLTDQGIPIRGTPFTLRKPQYVTSKDEVKISSIVEDSALHLSFSATAIWRGHELRLDEIQARSPRACGAFDLPCKGKKAAEDASGSAMANIVLDKYKGTKLLPNADDKPIIFELAGRKYSAQLIGRSMTSESDHINLTGNLYLKALP